MQIRLYSDSLGLPRKDVVSNGERYINILVRHLQKEGRDIHLIDRSRANNTATILYNWFLEDESTFDPADIIVIHEGVCDCAPRPIPEWIRNWISRMPKGLRLKIVKWLHNNRPVLLRNGFRFYRTKPKRFYEIYSRWFIQLGAKNCKVVVFNIAPTNDPTEAHSPGFRKDIVRYNTLMKKAYDDCAEQCVNVVFLDIYSELLQREVALDDFILKEDGHHLTRMAHALYAEKLISALGLNRS